MDYIWIYDLVWCWGIISVKFSKFLFGFWKSKLQSPVSMAVLPDFLRVWPELINLWLFVVAFAWVELRRVRMMFLVRKPDQTELSRGWKEHAGKFLARRKSHRFLGFPESGDWFLEFSNDVLQSSCCSILKPTTLGLETVSGYNFFKNKF